MHYFENLILQLVNICNRDEHEVRRSERDGLLRSRGGYERVPESYREISRVNGHMASHQLLIDNFCTCVYNRKMPYVNA